MARAGQNHKGGRPKGSKSAATLEREKVLELYRQKTMRSADILFNSQMSLARGQTFLYKIEKEERIGPKGGVSYIPKKPVRVTTEWEIEAYLQGEIDGDNEPTEPGDTYYFITAKEPDSHTIDSMLDRSLGKATQPLSGPDGGPLELSIIKYGDKN